MSEPFMVVSSLFVTIDALRSVLSSLGAQLVDSDTDEWLLQRGRSHVWVFLRPQDHFDEETIDLIGRRLGGRPGTFIIMEVERSHESEGIALEFAHQCMQRWPCVVYDCLQHVYDLCDVEHFLKLGKGFPPKTED